MKDSWVHLDVQSTEVERQTREHLHVPELFETRENV